MGRDDCLVCAGSGEVCWRCQKNEDECDCEEGPELATCEACDETSPEPTTPEEAI